MVRVDYNISEKDSLFGRYQADFGTRTTYAGLGLWPTYDVTHNQFLTVGEHHIFSPTLINEFDISYSRPVTSEAQPTEHARAPDLHPGQRRCLRQLAHRSDAARRFVHQPVPVSSEQIYRKRRPEWIRGAHTISIGVYIPARAAQSLCLHVLEWILFFSSMPNFLPGIPCRSRGRPTAERTPNAPSATFG